MSFKRTGLVSMALLLLLGLASCSDGQAEEEKGGRLKVVATFNAMKEFAEAVGGDRVEVATLIPDGAEPHGFEPKAQDIAALGKASVFVYNGLGMEVWAEEAAKAADNEELVLVNASEGAEPIELSGEEREEGEEAHGHAHGKYDPHLWLSLKGAETEVANIRDGLVRADPANKEYYEANCEDYITKLEALYSEYAEKFAAAPKKSFVTGHAAFAYLCRDFGLSQNSVEDVFAEGEPGAKRLAELVEYCRENGVTVIFAEELASPEVSRTLADEVGARVETIFTIAGSENGESYLERMEENLNKIHESLEQQ